MAERELTLDEAYDRYVAGKIMRRDLFRLIIDAVKELQTVPVTAAVEAKRVGWPKGRKRGQRTTNGHALDAMPNGDDPAA